MSLHLNLPTPNTDTIISILDLMSTRNPIYEQRRQIHLSMVNNALNIARCEYYSHPKLDFYTKKVYQPYFSEPIFPVVLKLVNTDTTRASFYMPHVDQKRLTSLNFYIDSGGPDVTTSTYEQEGNRDLRGHVCTYNDVTLRTREKMNEQKWYLLDVNRYHSVENIMNTRVVYALSFNNLCANDFQERYKHLVA